jgi:acyl carrier protein
MTQDDIRTEIRGFVKKNFIFDSRNGLDNSASLLGSGVIDSTGILELIAHIEQQYDIRCEDNELVRENFDSIDKITTFVAGKLTPRYTDNAHAA